MRKLLTMSAVCVALILVPATSGQGHSLWKHPKIRACMQWDWHKGTPQTRRMIGCYARVMNAPGTVSFVLCIAQRESGLYPRATSPSGTYRGLFQQSENYWWGRYQAYGSHLFPDIYNGRTNTVVSIRMAKARGGWKGDWPTAYSCD